MHTHIPRPRLHVSNNCGGVVCLESKLWLFLDGGQQASSTTFSYFWKGESKIVSLLALIGLPVYSHLVFLMKRQEERKRINMVCSVVMSTVLGQ